VVEFSICTTVFNNVDMLRRSLLSLIGTLTETDFETIVVDSYFTDGSNEVVKDLSSNSET
jgi:glycosyltransferase involved in cell wall biosynthesis